MSSFTIADAVALLAWTSFVLYQLFPNNIHHVRYYNSKVSGLRCVAPSSLLYYIPVFVACYGSSLIFAPFLYFRSTTNWSAEAIVVLTCMLLIVLVDKAWPYVFFEAKMLKTNIAIIVFMIIMSSTVLIFMALTPHWIPFVLHVPFNLLMVHLLIVSVDWYYTYSSSSPAAAGIMLTPSGRGGSKVSCII